MAKEKMDKDLVNAITEKIVEVINSKVVFKDDRVLITININRVKSSPDVESLKCISNRIDVLDKIEDIDKVTNVLDETKGFMLDYLEMPEGWEDEIEGE
jgi:ribosome-binding factor A